jgi:DNA recombination protein RmuC
MELLTAALLLLLLALAAFLAFALHTLPERLRQRLSAEAALQHQGIERSLTEVRTDFRDHSAAHSAALRLELQESLKNSTLLLDQRFQTLLTQTDARLQEIRSGVERRLQENLEQNFGAFKEMNQSLSHLKSSADQMLKVSEQVGELNQILASPKLQGNFGETALEKLLADILPPTAYEWQPRIAEGLQPDAAIRIKDARLCIDAKFPKDRIAAVLDQARDEASHEAARKELATVVRTMAQDIAKKYVRPDLGTADQAFLFVPSESLYYEILRMPELTEQCRKLKITPVSPNTLAATLYAVALAFRGYEMQENARALLRSLQDLDRHFQNFRDDFSKVGQRLRQAQDDYSKAHLDLDRFDKTIAKLKDGEPRLLEAD